jgi:hypothetical protein
VHRPPSFDSIGTKKGPSPSDCCRPRAKLPRAAAAGLIRKLDYNPGYPVTFQNSLSPYSHGGNSATRRSKVKSPNRPDINIFRNTNPVVELVRVLLPHSRLLGWETQNSELQLQLNYSCRGRRSDNRGPSGEWGYDFRLRKLECDFPGMYVRASAHNRWPPGTSLRGSCHSDRFT